MTDEAKEHTTYSLSAAINAATQELLATEGRTLIHANVIARKFAPFSMRDVKDLIATDGWILFAESRPGHLLVDSITAVTTQYILEKIVAAWEADAQKKANARVKKRVATG